MEGLNIAPHLTTDRQSKQTNYQSDLYERDSEVKQEQRDLILKFILNNHADIHPKYLGLPGKYWLFERQLLEAEPKSHIFAIEKDFEIFEKSRSYIEGHQYLRGRAYPWGHDTRTDFSNGIEYAKTTTFYYVCGDVHSLISDKFFKEAKGRNFYGCRSGKGIKSKSAIWLDFTESFNVKTYSTIHHIKNILHPIYHSVVCLTLQYGRDQIFNGSGIQPRIDIVQQALPQFRCLKAWTYKGFNDTSMINICGICLPDNLS